MGNAYKTREQLLGENAELRRELALARRDLQTFNALPVDLLRHQAQIIDQIHDAVVSTDLEGFVTSWSKGAERLHGFTAEEAIGKHISFIFPEEEREFLERQIIGPLKASGHLDVEVRVRHKSGEDLYVHLALSLLRDNSGRAMGTIGYGMDITEHKRAEATLRKTKEELEARNKELTAAIEELSLTQQALAESEERYRLMGETLPYGVWLCDDKGRAKYVSPSFLELLDMTLEEQRDFGWTRRLVPEDVEPMMEKWLDCVKTGEMWDHEHRIVDRNGKIHTILTRGLPVRDKNGTIRSWVGINLDITERKQAEESLLREKRFSESILDSLPGIFYLFDSEGRFIRWNRSFERVSGYSSEEILKIHPRDFFEGKDREEISRAIQEALTRGASCAEASFISKNGQRTPHYFSGILISIGGSSYLAGLGIDITDRKRMEEELRRSRDELELRVQERTAQLALALESSKAYAAQLELLNNELQEFAFVASHDLQEPLRKIQAFSDRLRSRCEASLGEEGCDYLRRMQSAANRMSSLLSALLGYSRVSTRGKPFAQVDLVHVAKEAVSDLEIAIEDAGAQVEIGSLPTLDADADQMRQVFQNLIYNALRYRREGEKPLIRVHGVLEKDVGQILVEDNGIGFDEKYLDRIFKPFQQLHGRSSKYEGTGMGLAICRKIVERHGGTITARSIPGKGSTFIVTLPVEHSNG